MNNNHYTYLKTFKILIDFENICVIGIHGSSPWVVAAANPVNPGYVSCLPQILRYKQVRSELESFQTIHLLMF